MAISNRQIALQRLAILGFTGNVDAPEDVDAFLGVESCRRHDQTGLWFWLHLWQNMPALEEYPGWYYWQVAQTTEDFLKLDYWYETTIQERG